MEYLVVRFPGSRPVMIDGEINGETNRVLSLVAGTHTISLGPPLDFSPGEGVEVDVSDTNPLEPRIVRFTLAGAGDSSPEDERAREV